VEVEIQWTFINICFQKFSLCLSFVVVFSLSRTLTLKSRSLSFSQLVFFLIPSLSLSLSLCACLRERSCAQTKESEGKEFLDCVGIEERRVGRERRELNFFFLLPCLNPDFSRSRSRLLFRLETSHSDGSRKKKARLPILISKQKHLFLRDERTHS
jgi:hypothetical protein